MDITELLNAAGSGDAAASERLYRAVYDELHRIARRERNRWRGQDTLNATALVHEAYLRLARPREGEWKNRGHFFAVAARAMRHILVDYAERQQAEKRGGGEAHAALDEEALARVPGDADPLVAPEDAAEVLRLHAALEELEALEPRRVRVVECRFFAGLPVAETAEALGISPATVKRDWALSRVWLYERLQGEGAG